MTCIIFPGLLFFLSGLYRWKWLGTEGGFHKKRLNLTSLPKYFPVHPLLPLRPGIRGCITEAWCRPIPLLRQDLRGARSQVYNTQLTGSIWSYCFGATRCWLRSTPCGRIPNARWQLIVVIMHAVLMFFFEIVHFKLALRNNYYTTESFCGSTASSALVVLLFLFNHQPIKSMGFSTTVQSWLGIFSFYTNTTSWKLDPLD